MTLHDSKWAMRCILTTLTCEFRPDAIIDLPDPAGAGGQVSARRPLMHVQAGALGGTELSDRLRGCSDAVIILHFEQPPIEARPPVPHALLARPAITVPNPRDPSQRTRYVAIGQSARAALIRLQQFALVTVIGGRGE